MRDLGALNTKKDVSITSLPSGLRAPVEEETGRIQVPKQMEHTKKTRFSKAAGSKHM